MGLKEEEIGKLEETAQKRKERLQAMRKKRTVEQDLQTGDNEELPESQVLFRNYFPQTDKFEDQILPQVEPENVEKLVEEQLKHNVPTTQLEDVEISSLAPKKITYDLRRGVQSQLDKLDKKCDKSIAELIRERLKEGRQQDFLLAVNVGARAQQKDAYDSDDD